MPEETKRRQGRPAGEARQKSNDGAVDFDMARCTLDALKANLGASSWRQAIRALVLAADAAGRDGTVSIKTVREELIRARAMSGG